MSEHTVDQLTELYIQYRDYLEREADAQQKKVKPYRDAMEQIEGMLHAKLQEAGATSVKTPHGTPYLSTTMSARVADRGALFDFVRTNQAFDLLTAAVSKEAVKQHMEDHNDQPPPGVDITFVTKLLVRRS